MRKYMHKLKFMLIAALLLSVSAQAQYTSVNSFLEKPTELADVLASVQEHFPLIKAAKAEISGKDALVRAAQGAFDPVVEGAYKNRINGYYDGSSMETFYVKRFPAMGAEVFAGVRHSDGNFPTYESNLGSAKGGESRVGVSFSLWRNREFDDLRYQTASTQVDAITERYKLQEQLINVLQDTYVAYAQWLQAARLLSDYSELMAIAEARAEAIRQSVQSGNAAEILAVDNDLAVLQRRSLVVDAQRLLDASAYKLALYYRYEDGSPRLPHYQDDLNMPEESLPDTSDIDAILNRIVELDPQIAMARMDRQQEELEVKLANNMAKPKVDLRFYNARNLGNGSAPLMGPENVADVSFSIPLATKTAVGKANAARAHISVVNYRIKQYMNEARTALEIALVNLSATREIENIALQELDASGQLVAAESRRFEAGLSDFFQLNLREQVLAQAELKRWRAHFEHQVALANFYTVSMNLEALGLDSTIFNMP